MKLDNNTGKPFSSVTVRRPAANRRTNSHQPLKCLLALPEIKKYSDAKHRLLIEDINTFLPINRRIAFMPYILPEKARVGARPPSATD